MFKSLQARSGPIKGAPLVTSLFADGQPQARNKQARRTEDRLPGFKAELGECFVHQNGDITLGLGRRAELDLGSLRTVGARLIRRLDRLGFQSANMAILDDKARKALGGSEAGRCLAEGMALANWRVDFFTGKASNLKPAHGSIVFGVDDAPLRAGMEEGFTRADAVNYARRIAVTPPNICDPQWMVGEARRLAREANLKFSLVDFNQAKRLGMGGLVNVGMGSDVKPCLIILEHKPSKPAPRSKGQRVALVGKTITYDTGGYSLKVNNGMKGMKYDKCGGMAVLGAMRAVAEFDLPVHVTGVLAVAENMVSGNSYRPDDIITMYNGVSVEVTNTDAEGRLVLADALTYACRDLEATQIVELSTLTGGIVTALGHFCAGLFCNDQRLLARVQAAAETSGDKVWQMPLWKEHREFMRSPHADILNSNPSRNAHPIQGAAFLDYFVDEGIPWAHLDIAAMGNVEKDTDLFVVGPTGWGVRLLVDLVQGFAG